MKRAVFWMTFAAVLLICTTTVSGRGYDEQESRTIRESIPVGSADGLVVDNLHGSVTVTTIDAPEIRVEAVETIRARSRDHIERARQEVSLRLFADGDRIVLCADGPFRDADDCTEWHDGRSSRNPGYEVHYELTVRVPAELDLRVRTVDGDLDIRGTRGRFDIRGVNGRIDMNEIEGSGEAHTVNGGVRVSFVANPEEDSEFRTINGDLDVVFQPVLSADMSFETMNGDVLTDFEYDLLPPGPLVRNTRGERTKYKLDPGTAIRIAGGGPRHHFENINGDILIRESR